MTNSPFEFASMADSDRPKYELQGRCQHFEAHPSYRRGYDSCLRLSSKYCIERSYHVTWIRPVS